jgi:replicative DNA helicase
VFFVSLEVKPDNVAMQFAATLSKVGVRRLSNAHRLDQKNFQDALTSLRGLSITVSDSHRSLASICAKARALHASRPLDLIVVDYLGLVEDCDRPNKGETKTSAIGRVTKGFKRLAMDLDCVVLVAAQLNRTSVTDKRSDDEHHRVPRLSDLRDSGDIEQDADKVIFIHRPDEDPDAANAPQNDTSNPSEFPSFFVNLIQAKGRDDGTGTKSMRFIRETASFMPRATQKQQHNK